MTFEQRRFGQHDFRQPLISGADTLGRASALAGSQTFAV